MSARDRRVGLRERLKELRRLFARHARPRVIHRNAQDTARRRISHADTNLDASAISELGRVAHQIHQDLSQARGIRQNRAWDRTRQRGAQRHPFLRRPSAHQAVDIEQHARQVRLDALDDHATGFDLRNIQNVVDDVE